MSGPVLAAVLVAAVALAVGGARRASTRGVVVARLTPPAAAGRRPLAGIAPPPAWLTPRLAAAGVAADPATVWTAWVLAAACGVPVAVVWAGPPGGLVLAAAALVGPPAWWWAARDRGDRRLEASLPDALETVARAVRSGASLTQAVAEAATGTPGPLGADLRSVSATAERGGGLVAGLEAWAERRPLPGVRLAVAALALGAETGGPQARAIDGVAATLRQRTAVAAEVRALSSQARASALVIGVSPLAFAALASSTDPRAAGFLLQTPLGLAMLVAGLALDAAGAVWMARLTRPQP